MGTTTTYVPHGDKETGGKADKASMQTVFELG